MTDNEFSRAVTSEAVTSEAVTSGAVTSEAVTSEAVLSRAGRSEAAPPRTGSAGAVPSEVLPSWPVLLTALLRGEALPLAQTSWAMGQIMAGEASPAQLAGFAVALRAKGETAEEVAGLVEVMLANATPLDVTNEAVDVVGTGGDRAHTVNISTMAAIVVAGAGVRVVKHGNRAASSLCGSADLLEELGVGVDLEPALVARCVAEVGIGFCFAPRFHPGLRHASAVRGELGIPTVFNFLGPLTNPGRPRAAAVGCADPRMAPVMAGVLARRGDSAFVIRGEDGLDEFTTTSPTRLWIVRGGEVRETLLDSADLGLPRSAADDLRGGKAAYNAAVTRSFLGGERGPVRDAVLVNAAVALAAYGYRSVGEEVVNSGVENRNVTGEIANSDSEVFESIARGLALAAEAVDSGAAAAVLDRWVGMASSQDALREARPGAVVETESRGSGVG